MRNIFQKICRKFLVMWLQPIRVFCFHQTSELFDASTMWECDWTQIDQFKANILHLKEQYTFISLQEAYDKLQHDICRSKKYAVITADDGWASLKNIIPWLAEMEIPITLFVNSAYLDGCHYQDKETEKLLVKQDLIDLVNLYPQCVTIASHGEQHIDTRQLTEEEFRANVLRSEDLLSKLSNKIGFYAFTYGRYTRNHIVELKHENIVPVLMDGKMNYFFDEAIHRECIDGVKL